jgi:hypothetical protein
MITTPPPASWAEAKSGGEVIVAECIDQVVLAVEPARLGASAQLLLDSPALNAAVSLLALGATLTQRT